MDSTASSSDDAATVQALIEVLQGTSSSLSLQVKVTLADSKLCLIASPEFRDFNGDFGSEFLTSPLDESPWEEMLTTPALESGDNMSADILTSPAIIDTDDFGLGGMPLFADAISYSRTLDPIKTSPHAPMVQHPVFDGLYTMPSPDTPSLDPASFHASPSIGLLDTPSLTPATPGSRRKSPTGTRKNLNPEDLVPFDAPIQNRKYLTPSATSRKEVPAVFAKKTKRGRSVAFGDDDLLEDEDMEGVDMDAIEAKRRQNTLAARRSRKRKLEYQRELEASVEKEKEEKDQWKTRALFYKALLESHGHDVPTI